jgi:hypothetical protein
VLKEEEKMKKIYAPILAAILVMAAFLVITPQVMAGNNNNGNNAPSGPHWNLNIIGVQKDKKGNFQDYDPTTDGYNNPPTAHDNGHRIFVDLWSTKNGVTTTTKIWLVKGDNFQVIDPDGTDGRATLQLKDPFLQDDPGEEDYWTVEYQIYVRALGKPGGKANITSGFLDELGTQWLSVENVTLERTKNGPPKFSEKTLELTTIYVDITDDGVDNPVRYRLFDNELWQYFWDYDNHGLKLCQIRIYEIPKTLEGPGIPTNG